LEEKEDGMKDLKEAVKINFKNPIPYHFIAMYYKEERNLN